MGQVGQVFFVTRKWPPAVGGMETYSVELTRELSGHTEVEVVALPGQADGSAPHWSSFFGFAFRTMSRYLRRQKVPAVFHVGDLAAWPLALATWCRPGRPQIVLSAHGSDAGFHRRGGLKGNLYGFYLRTGAFLLRNARMIANSAATAEAAAENGWTALAVVPLATAMRSEEPPASHGPHLLFAGRLVEQKGCRWFVEHVLPHLPDDMDLRVAGTLWDETERMVLDHPRVTYLGALSQLALMEEFRAALCVIVPNIEMPNGEFEGFGLVAAEAAAAGGLVLASASGGLVEAVLDDETGFLLPPGDADKWRMKIEEIARFPDERRKAFIRDAMIKAQEHYSWKRVARDVLEVYDDREGAPVDAKRSRQ